MHRVRAVGANDSGRIFVVLVIYFIIFIIVLVFLFLNVHIFNFIFVVFILGGCERADWFWRWLDR